jgi:lipopolysaccharide assembly outer membrane protein LptD (OstA)
VIAAGSVVLKQEGVTLTCQRLEATQDLNQVEARGEVVINKDKTKMTAEQLNLNYKSQEGVLTGNPKLTQPQMLVTGDKFNFNLETGYLEVIGQAHLEDKEQDLVGDAHKIKYNQEQNQVVFLENVKVVRGKRTLEAPKVIVDLKQKKMTAEGKTKFTIPREQGDENAD